MKKIKLIIFILLTTLLSGCWDKLEINERTFVLGFGIDYEKQEKSDKKYLMSYQYPNLNAMGDKPQAVQQAGFMSVLVKNPFEGSRYLSTKLDKPVFFKHVKTIVLGDEMAKNREFMKEVLDGIDRDQRMNRKVKVVIASGKAKDVIACKPKQGSVSGMYISNLMDNNINTAKFTDKVFVDLVSDLSESGVSLVPKVSATKDEITLSGGGIIKDYKLIGSLTGDENELVNYLTENVKSEIIIVNYNDVILSYVITKIKVDKKVEEENQNLKVTFSVTVDGYVQDYRVGTAKKLFLQDTLDDIEKEINKKLVNEFNILINKLQNKYNADIIGVSDYIMKFKPDLWKKIGENWDEVFPNIDIDVVVDARIRRTGFTK